MPSFRTQLPSKSDFYRAADFDSGPRTLTIETVSTTNLGQDGKTELKLVANFREPDAKRLVLNLARAEAIADVVGSEDTDRWAGARIVVKKGQTRYQGQRVPCMVVEAPADDVKDAVGF